MSALRAGSMFAGRLRGYFAPVQRTSGTPVAFDPASMGRFDLEGPPVGWLDAGVMGRVQRDAGEGWKPVWSGSPSMARSQGRARVEEMVEVELPGWTRLAVALSSGMQTMNLLKTQVGAVANPSGGAAVVAEAVGSGSTATVLQMAATTAVQAGDVVVVDVDYAGATGWIGSGAAGAFVAQGTVIADVDYARRVSFNVARVASVAGGVVTLASPLMAGAPDAGMKLSVVEGFTDRNGGSFLEEWSALFVVEGFQGDRLLLHYPRLEPAGESAAERADAMAEGVTRWRPVAKLRAMPVTDATDGVAAVCFRSYLPAPMRSV